jgi:hypothetical protein
MGTMEQTVILNSQDVVQAERTTSVVLGVVLAEHDTTSMQLRSATRPTEPTR